MSSDHMREFVRDLISTLSENGVYVLEQTPYDVVVDGTFDPDEIAGILARKWTCAPAG